MSFKADRNKNLIINGNFDVWQRGTSFATAATNTISADRFRYQKVGTMVHTLSRSADVPTVAESGTLSNYSLLATLTTADNSIAAGDFTHIIYRIEGYDWARVAQKPVTVSFWVKSTLTGTYCVAFRNSGTDRSFVKEYTIDATNTWEKKVLTFDASPSAGTWDYTNGAGIQISFTLACGSSFHGVADTWNSANDIATSNQVNGVATGSTSFRIAQVQVEEGSVATSFEVKNIEDEISRCQRYYQKTYNLTTDPGSATLVGSRHANVALASTYFRMEIMFKQSMRAAPTVVLYSNSGTSGKINMDGTDETGTVLYTGDSGFASNTAPAGPPSVAYYIYHWTAVAEL
jgi:hypothetical protein